MKVCCSPVELVETHHLCHQIYLKMLYLYIVKAWKIIIFWIWELLIQRKSSCDLISCPSTRVFVKDGISTWRCKRKGERQEVERNSGSNTCIKGRMYSLSASFKLGVKAKLSQFFLTAVYYANDISLRGTMNYVIFTAH